MVHIPNPDSPVLKLPRFFSLKADNGKYLMLKSDGTLAFESDTTTRYTTHEAVYNANDSNASFVICSANKHFWRRHSSTSAVVADLKNPPSDTDASNRFKLQPEVAPGKVALSSVQDGLFLKRFNTQYRALLEEPNEIFAMVEVVESSYYVVNMPEYVGFKGSNAKYLTCLVDYPVILDPFALTEESADVRLTTHQVEYLLNGKIALRSNQAASWTSNNYWRASQWITPDGDTPDHPECQFDPVRVNSTTVALKSANGLYCKRGSPSFTNAPDAIFAEASDYEETSSHLVVEEAVMSRQIFNVTYLLDLASASEEEPIGVAYGSATNKGSEPAEMEISVSKTTTVSNTRSFHNSFTFSQSITQTLTLGVPFFADESTEIQIGAEQEFGNQWDETLSEEVAYQTTYKVTIPPGKTGTVQVVISTAKLAVPFHYKTRDTSLNGVEREPVDRIDGVFDGVLAYRTDAEIYDGTKTYRIPVPMKLNVTK
ncbi:uncharacterized protein LOC9643118 [Selaginella moellendorffii]|uniref:uncharacterized protein LOC9643118 n=1 Tax=Selaginella moellendorffii TaxID=88036 RepID=UPI000D1C39C5|nr:uncharacterized protein LOC9643118 [Selaginella moellendorffii]|eukprot:XP_024543681.1 uncharacterized protein LOC9643118 [Selaginella moellendorffii]